MKSPLRKLRGLTSHHHRGGSKDKKDRGRRQPERAEELVQATQDMIDMRSCYDSLLSAAAATANSAYEFSEALDEMGTCLLEKTALNEDEDSGRVLLMLGKVQFELQKLVDSYRAHVIQTITTPSESLLKELHTVEELKHQCDEKRDLYKCMLATQGGKGRLKHTKGESFSLQQLQEAQESYEEETNLFVFRLKSLKQGQSRSLLTQATRHHAAQLNFFRKGLNSLEAIEPHVKVVADKERIDYQFSGLEDDDTEEEDDCSSYDGNDDGELSFDYGRNDRYDDSYSSSNSMELDQPEESIIQTSTADLAQENVDQISAELLVFNKKKPAPGSQSAPVFPDKKFDPPEKIIEMRPASTRKYHTYALPTPSDAKRSVSIGSVSPVSRHNFPGRLGASTQLWHSSPLEPHRFVNRSRDDELLGPTKFPKAHATVLRESNINSGPLKMPPALNEELSKLHSKPLTDTDTKRRHQSFSGPLIGRPGLHKPNMSAMDSLPSVEPHAVSRTPGPVRAPRPSLSPRASPNISPPPMRSPMISELHELPRPPAGSARSTRPISLIGHSAPLVYRGPNPNKTTKTSPVTSRTASPLPTPPPTVQRSYSIPSRRTSLSPVTIESVASPPLTPMSLRTIYPSSQAS